MKGVRFLIAIVSATVLAGVALFTASVAAQNTGTKVMAQRGHSLTVLAVMFSPDNRFVLTGGMDKQGILWDVATGRQLHKFGGHTGEVASIAFSPDGRFALTASDDNTAKQWDIDTGREVRTFCTRQSLGASLSPDGRYAVCVVSDPTTSLSFGFQSEFWDTASGKLAFKASEKIVTFTPDGRRVLTKGFSQESAPDGSGYGAAQETLWLWDTTTGKQLHRFTGPIAKFTTAVLTPDGNALLTGGSAAQPESFRLWDMATGQQIRSYAFTPAPFTIPKAKFSPDGRVLVLSNGSEKEASLREASTGRELASFKGNAVMFAADGQSFLSSSEGKMRLRRTADGKELRAFETWERAAISHDGRLVVTAGNPLKLWDAASGAELRELGGTASAAATATAPTPPVTAQTIADTSLIKSVAYSPDGHYFLTASAGAPHLWDATTGRLLRSFGGEFNFAEHAVFSPDGKFVLSAMVGPMKLWDLATGREVRSFGGAIDSVKAVAYSRDGRFILSGGGIAQGEMKLWDAATGAEVRKFSGMPQPLEALALSPDGRFALSGAGSEMKLWDAATGKELRTFTTENFSSVNAVAFSPDGRFVLSTGMDTPSAQDWKKIFEDERATGKKFDTSKPYTASVLLWDVSTGKLARKFSGHGDRIITLTYSPDGRYILSGSADNTLKLWDAVTGADLRTFSGHTYQVESAAFSPDGRFILSGSMDGTARIWHAGTGKELTRMTNMPSGGWLAMTPEGFFASSQRDTGMLAVVRGTVSTSIGQVHSSLFNPDLVREALAGDPDGEVLRAAEVINLEKVLASGPPPIAAITSHKTGSRSSSALVTVAARITDSGKGIGRIEWRVNGVTTGVMSAPACFAQSDKHCTSAGTGAEYNVQRELALDPGENEIEVIAYEGRNLLASLPARGKIIYDAPADTEKPKLHILVIGINAYTDTGWTPPGSTEKLAFPPLHLAVADAKAFAAELQKAGTKHYSEVRVIEALDTDATPAKLDALFAKAAASISPRDTFVFYAAAHGYSTNGRYYLIPQDYQGGGNPEALKTFAISQERIQGWIANHIKARKAVILLDTCESGALVGGYSRSRTDVAASEAAIGRLHEATGRPVLTAAASGKPAFEGYKGHGVFTYALIEALHKADTNNNGLIELSEFVAHTEQRVPELVAELDRSGGVVKGAVVTAARGAGGAKQSAHFGSTGEDFELATRLP